jgi:hypothetical protein
MKSLVFLLLIGFFAAECGSQTALPVPSLQLTTKRSGVFLKWNSASGMVSGFVIEKKEGNGHWMIVGQADPDQTYYEDRNITASATYYRIRSFNKHDLSDYSNVQVQSAR